MGLKVKIRHSGLSFLPQLRKYLYVYMIGVVGHEREECDELVNFI